ncbi:MAG: hypothetical protein IBX45_00055 [Campylobacterales bacterium]|nr:hypothetical protein [Campylobacterales bacterium]
MKTLWPQDAVFFQEEGATVPFVRFVQEGVDVLGFDSRACVPPEPMVNAMLALAHIKNPQTKVVMINHRSPVGLLAKIGEQFEIASEELEHGAVKLTFSYKEGATQHADLSSSHCAG